MSEPLTKEEMASFRSYAREHVTEPDGTQCQWTDYTLRALDMIDAMSDRVAELRAEPRDEYHTMRELYEYRMLYNAHAARGWLAAGIPVVKSWRHSDGEPCFGGGWFIVVATLPTGQVSNHYKAEYWSLFDVPEVELPPEYDGHTPQVVAERLRDAVAAAEGASDRE